MIFLGFFGILDLLDLDASVERWALGAGLWALLLTGSEQNQKLSV